jgi:prevent-host-death family protein
MDTSKRYRPISYLQTNAADLAKEISERAGPVVITQDGQPSFVCVSMEEYFEMKETNALIKIINLGRGEIKRGKYESLADARASLDAAILKDDVAD